MTGKVPSKILKTINLFQYLLLPKRILIPPKPGLISQVVNNSFLLTTCSKQKLHISPELIY